MLQSLDSHVMVIITMIKTTLICCATEGGRVGSHVEAGDSVNIRPTPLKKTLAAPYSLPLTQSAVALVPRAAPDRTLRRSATVPHAPRQHDQRHTHPGRESFLCDVIFLFFYFFFFFCVGKRGGHGLSVTSFARGS